MYNVEEKQTEFFVIDSNNLESIETKLYGFTIINGMVIENTDLVDIDKLDGSGGYVYIKKTDDKIIVKQDYVGAYGLYLFRDGDYFALSNSFMFLVDYIKKDHKISFNKAYADYFIVADLCSVAYKETLVKEIESVDRSAIIYIDIASKKLDMNLFDYQENTVELNSAEGMQILDNWFHKWTSLIKNLKMQTNNIKMDLSGGFDSRLILTLFLCADINLDEIVLNSSMSNTSSVFIEDFEIATAISNYYKFNLNNKENLSIKRIPYTMNDILDISFYTKLGVHKQTYYKRNFAKNKFYTFGGDGGECVRDYWSMSDEKYISNEKNRCRSFSGADISEFGNSVEFILQSAFDGIKEKFCSFGREIDTSYLLLNLYKETRNRNHFGKEIIENYFGGTVKFTPLLDPDLHKLKLSNKNCSDKNLLMAVIFDRYNKDILDFKFEGKRSINKKTIRYAKSINEKYKFTPCEIENHQIIPAGGGGSKCA